MLSAIRRCVALVAALITVPALAAPSSGLTVVSEGPYTAPTSHQFVVHSGALGRDFLVVVSPPVGGLPLGPGEKHPAIYALDGGYSIAGPMGQYLSWAWVMTPAYVVSVGYLDGAANERDTDLLFRTTVRDGKTIGGGGAAFLAFLDDELRPFLESRYPIDPAKAILFGHSYGGLFAANVLADAPQSFSGYVLASISVTADPGVIDRLAAAAPKGGGRRVYVAVGANEDPAMVPATHRIAQALAAPGSGFKV